MKWKTLKIFIFEIWNEKKWKFSFLKFEMKIKVSMLKKLVISLEGSEKKWNEEIIYFIYATAR
jgi:hypothetical protein